MDSSVKRPSNTSQNVDINAVCPKCSRLSKNLRICDNCGNPLPEDSAAPVYGSDPKRRRVEAPPNGNITNGNSKSASPATSLPVSQPLMNNMVGPPTAPGATGDSIRPQTLYVNVNNQAYPVVRVQGNEGLNRPGAIPNPSPAMPMPMAGMQMPGQPIPQTGMASLMHGIPSHSQALPNTPLTPLLSASSVPSQNIMASLPTSRPLSNTQLTAALPQQPQVSLQNFNLQPPPPYSTQAGAPAANVQLPAAAHPPAANQASANSGSGQGPATLANVPAYQIRIGSRKFKPLSTVAFKEDGILFTLKDYTYAPVLLNARAIIRCRASLKHALYPIICLYLEGSCMRQIRQIFELTEDEFSEHSSVDIKRCITIFPQLESDGRSQASTVKGIVQSFERMVKRYPRAGNILEMIDADMVIDIMLGASVSETATRVQSTSQPPSQPAAVTNAAQPPARTSNIDRTPQNTTHQNSSHTSSRNTNRLSASSSRSSSKGGVSSTIISSGPPTLLNNAQAVKSAAMTLNIPNDEEQWQKIQKGLVQGGVYHVELPNGQRKYCLWNGNTLVPCLVQNMEIQLTASEIYVGSYHYQSESQVRVKADMPAGIHLSIKPNTRIAQAKEVTLFLNDLTRCRICLDHNLGLIFLQPKAHTARTLRADLQLANPPTDPTIDPSSTVVKRGFVTIFLKNINNDQKEALLQMKHPNSLRSFFDLISPLNALKHVAEVKGNSKALSRINDYTRLQPPVSSQGAILDSVSKLLLGDNSMSQQKNTTVVQDDDDDDVIMTSEEVGIKCPYTQQVMKDPIRNKICNHNYEKAAIQEFILRKKGNAKCPYSGCGNSVPLSMSDLEENSSLKEYIQKNASKS